MWRSPTAWGRWSAAGSGAPGATRRSRPRWPCGTTASGCSPPSRTASTTGSPKLSPAASRAAAPGPDGGLNRARRSSLEGDVHRPHDDHHPPRMVADRLVVVEPVPAGEHIEEVTLRVGLDPLHDTAHLQVPIGPFGIVDAQRHRRITFDIAAFRAVRGRGQ